MVTPCTITPQKAKTKFIISQHFSWKGLCKLMQDTCSKCRTCQFLIQGKRIYSKLPSKEAEIQP